MRRIIFVLSLLFAAGCEEDDLSALADSGSVRDAEPLADATALADATVFPDAAVFPDAEYPDAETFDDATVFPDAEQPDADEPDAGEPDTGEPSTEWTEMPIGPIPGSDCTGMTYVRWVPTYTKWIAISLCTATRYKIGMADTMPGPYYAIGDYAGSGQDHCELVNPAFTIPNEDDITSGGCAACMLGPFSNPGVPQPGPPGYSRARFGDQFLFEPAWPEFNLYTPRWYECGIALP